MTPRCSDRMAACSALPSRLPIRRKPSSARRAVGIMPLSRTTLIGALTETNGRLDSGRQTDRRANNGVRRRRRCSRIRRKELSKEHYGPCTHADFQCSDRAVRGRPLNSTRGSRSPCISHTILNATCEDCRNFF